VAEVSDVLDTPAPELDDDALRELLRREWGIEEGRLTALASERDRMARVGDAWVLKVSSPAQPLDDLDFEERAAAHALRADPLLPLPATAPTRRGETVAWVEDARGRRCAARLISLLPGEVLEGTELDLETVEEIGVACARMQRALAAFAHPAAARAIDWDLRSVAASLARVADRAATVPGLVAVVDRVAPALAAAGRLPSRVQHADVTLTNVLALDGRVSGVIDFGDAHVTSDVCDLAVTATSVLRASGPQRHTPDELLAAVLRGYQRLRPLERDEAALLGELILARLALTLLISLRRADVHVDNADYITRYDTATRDRLVEWAAIPPAELADRFLRLSGHGTAGEVATDELRERRRAAMGGTISPLMYGTPLHIVRAEGVYLWSADGTRYLDGYNNVAVVGHAHPAVAAAVGRQLATFNSHSRYLHPEAVRLAERLLASAPPGLDTCLFTTSGSEANELAWRLAVAVTGGDAAIVVENAYHGVTSRLTDLTPNEWPAGWHGDRVALMRAPHDEGEELSAELAAARVADATERLAMRGSRPAAVLVDPQFTSEGILDAPPEYLAGLVHGAHAAGALFIADEVQSGVGRSGPAMWRSNVLGVAPDILTAGKPLGAGYPVGAVLTRREIADALREGWEYFSTFAATPAAAAAGNAVLDVLELEGHAERAPAEGERLRAALREVAAASGGRLGTVRGSGLIAGVATEDRSVARGLVERLVGDHRILLGATGKGGDVLKIRPPLVWRETHTARLAEALSVALDV